jgi:hypothetical protein
MRIRKTVVSILTMASMLGLAGASLADSAKKDPAASLQLPITGTVSGGGSFAGTFDLQKFVVRDGQVAALGIVRGTVTSAAGVAVGSALVGPVTLPVQVSAGAPLTTAAPAASVAAPVAAQATCAVLHIDIGAANLNVLGLQVATQPIGLDISGDTGGVLGNLVCTVLDTLNNVVGLVGLLNQILGLLTGLLGAIIPG